MGTKTPRLERLLADRLEDCCDEDVEQRLAELEDHGETARAAAATDVTALSTLGDETRYTIVRLLAATDGNLCVCEIEPVVSVSDSAVSHALSDLRDAGLVTRRKAGTWRYYAATDRAEALVDTLDATRDGGTTAPEAGPDE